jgi:hypothetical protein
MYYKDSLGNVTDFSSTHHGQYHNASHPGGVDYHQLSREDFTYQDAKNWLEKYKMWFFYSLLVVLLFIVIMWIYNHNKYKHRKTAASVFY